MNRRIQKQAASLTNSIAVACESLECRRLLAGEINIYLNGSIVPASSADVIFDFATSGLVGGPEPSLKFEIRNETALGETLTIEDISITFLGYIHTENHGDFNNQNNNNTTFTLAPGAKEKFELRLPTGVATQSQGAFFIQSSDVDELTRTVRVRGSVVSAGAFSTKDLGSLNTTPNPVADAGAIEAFERSDNQGSTLTQAKDRMLFFELPATLNTVEVKLSGSLGALADGGKLSALFVRERDNETFKQLSVAERESPIGELVTATLTTTTINKNATFTGLSNGRYILYLYAKEISGTDFQTNPKLNYSTTIKVTAAPPAQIQVLGNNVLIANGDSTPSTTDGTDFGSVAPGVAKSIEFTIKNTGGSPLNFTGDPIVSGDFVLETGLPSSLAAAGTTTFRIKLNNTTAGDRTGLVSVSSNLGSHIFNVKGKVVAQAPAFVLAGDTLSVTGTSSDDVIVMTLNGATFTATLNGASSNPFSTTTVKKVVIEALAGNDYVSSTTSLKINQTINGGDGNDFLRGAKGKDSINGGLGNDRIDGAGNTDFLSGGDGSDYAYYSSRSLNLSITLDGVANDGEIGEIDSLFSLEHIQSGSGNDTLVGESHNNVIRGGAGNDLIIGGKGNDRLEGGTGINTISADAGNDTIVTRNSAIDIIDGAAGTDTLTGDLTDDHENVESLDLI